MISTLRGVPQQVNLNSAIIEVGGFGMLIQATPRRLPPCRSGARSWFTPPWWCVRIR